MAARAKKKLLVVCHTFGVPSEIWISRQIESFEQFDTSVLCWEQEPSGYKASCPVHCLQTEFAAPERSPLRWLRRLWLAPTGNVRASFGGEKSRLLELTRAICPDVVLCHFGHTALRFLPIAQILKIPLVSHFHGLDTSSALKDRYYLWSLRGNFKRFAEAIVVGTHQRRKLVELGMPPERIQQIPCGAPTTQFSPKSDYRSDACAFITVSRLIEWKGLDYSLKAFALARATCPQIKLHIVGSGTMEKDLRALAASLRVDDAVTFHGNQVPDAVHRLMLQSDVFLQHSLDHSTGWTEGFGVSITEAAASGLPLVVSHCGGIVDQVADGDNGFVVPQRDCETMAKRMVELAQNQDLRERMGQRGRERAVTEFDSKLLAAKLQARLLRVAQGGDSSDAPLRPSDPLDAGQGVAGTIAPK